MMFPSVVVVPPPVVVPGSVVVPEAVKQAVHFEVVSSQVYVFKVFN
jgi:hypothetical protein